MPDHASAPFKYTMPIARAIVEDDELYIIGEATGPEVDAFDTRMRPELIRDFANQIKERAAAGDPIRYTDSHNPDGVLSELGELVDAGVSDQQHLVVKVRLDKENEAARFLHRSLQRGKRYGMSIGGSVVGWMDEYVKEVGRIVRTFTKVVITHIANTTMPAWTPSLGTVLARAVEKAVVEGVSVNNDSTSETPQTEGVEETKAPVTEVAAPAAEVVAAAVTEPAPVAEIAASTEAPAEVAAAPAPETPAPNMIPASALTPIADAVASLANAFNKLMPTAQPDAARSLTSEPPVAGNDEMVVLRTAVDSLRTDLASANARIKQLENEPEGNQPPVLERSETNVFDELAKLPPHQRLLIGLEAAKTAAKQ